MDMGGNVAEWVADWYARDYYERRPNENPTGPKSDSARVVHGGAFILPETYARASNRVSGSPGIRDHALGFRCARSVP
jgi:formylglycine-generating enzyme required for sulfatase activity